MGHLPRNHLELAPDFVAAVEVAIAGVPRGFFDSFRYNETGNNLCHPRTLGYLAKAAWTLPATAAVEIDVRFNLGTKVKFQPDLAIRDRQENLLLLVDFESPNSSDARIIRKDVEHYLSWTFASSTPKPVEYLIITSLPDKSAPEWQVRHYHRERRAEIRRNPFRYWYRFYLESLNSRWAEFPIGFANFHGGGLTLIDMSKL